MKLLVAVLPDIAQVSLETLPDTGSGPGIMLELDSTSVKPQSKSWAQIEVGWRLSYFPDASGKDSDAYGALEKIIERVFDSPIEESAEGHVYRFQSPRVIRTQDGVFLKITTITNMQRNKETYDQIKDVQLSTGG